MQKKVMLTVLVFMVLMLSMDASAQMTEVKLGTLIENLAEYDGKTVTVRGEVLGEVMERGEFAWINITDTTNAIGVWMKLNDAGTINAFGDYKHRGDVIRITGVFHKACKGHDGELDIHGGKIEIIEPGYAIPQRINTVKIIGVAVLLPIFIGKLCIFYWKMKK